MTALLLALTLHTVLPGSAESLFDEGNHQFKKGHYAEACALFARSHALEPSLGALMNWGVCLEKEGRLAAASAKLNEALAWAKREKSSRRERTIAERLKALKPRLALLEVRATAATSDEVLVFDGSEYALANGPVSIAVDAGRVSAVVRASGRQEFELEALAPSAGKTLVVVVPELERSAEVADVVLKTPAAEEVPLFDAEPVEAPAPRWEPPLEATVFRERARRRNPLAVTGVVTGGVMLLCGVAGLTWNFASADALMRQQPGGPDALRPTVTRAQFELMRWSYPASWAALGLGAATTIVSAVWLARTETVSIAPTPMGVSVQGRW